MQGTEPEQAAITIKAANYYLRAGLKPIPLIAGQKRPRPEAWQHGYFNSVEEISEHYCKYPEDGVGLVCGEQAGYFALDVDAAHGGYESLSELTEEHGPLPMTPEQATGGGGAHFIFAYPSGHRIKNRAGIRPGLDVRAGFINDKGKLEGVGQIASFPSRHPSGDMYRWVHAPWETSLEDAPEWLIELIEAPSAPKDYVSDGTRIRVGDRHDFLVHESARLRGMGYDAKTIRVLLHALYTERCELDPPMPPEEIDEIAEWFEDKAVNEFDTSWPGKKFKKAPITEDDDGSGWTYTGQTLTLGQTQFKEVALPFYDASSPLVFPEKQRWWGGRITHPSSILIHGDAKLGKTESTLRLLDSAFTGGSFLGDFTVGFTPKVLYLEEEGAGDMQAKLKAYGWTPDQVVALSSDDLFGLPWMSLAVSTLKYAVEHGFNLIVVDTLSTYFTVANGEKRDLYTTAQGFRALFSYAKRNGISVWAIHHDNASGSIYGRNEMAAQFDILVHHKFDETKDIDTWTFAGRYFGQPKPDPICYRYDKATGERHLISAEEIGEIGGVSPRTRNILDVTDYLKHHPEGVEWAEVSGFLGNTPRTTVQEYLDLAVERLGGRKQVGRGQGTKTRWYPDQEAL